MKHGGGGSLQRSHGALPFHSPTMANSTPTTWTTDPLVYEEELLPAADWSYDSFGQDAKDAVLCGYHLRTDDENIFGKIPETDISGCSWKSRIRMYYVIRDDGRVPFAIDVVFDYGSKTYGGHLRRVKATIMLTQDDI